MQLPAMEVVSTPLSAVKSASTMLPAPRSLARMAALPYLALMLRAKASMLVVLPAPRKPLVTMYFVFCISFSFPTSRQDMLHYWTWSNMSPAKKPAFAGF